LTARILHDFVERWNSGGAERVVPHLTLDYEGDGEGGQSLSNV
jgi:hypothetical protein